MNFGESIDRSLEDVLLAASRYADLFGTEQARKLLKADFGVGSLRDLRRSQYDYAVEAFTPTALDYKKVILDLRIRLVELSSLVDRLEKKAKRRKARRKRK